jgi:hypothetical protein
MLECVRNIFKILGCHERERDYTTQKSTSKKGALQTKSKHTGQEVHRVFISNTVPSLPWIGQVLGS